MFFIFSQIKVFLYFGKENLKPEKILYFTRELSKPEKLKNPNLKKNS